MATKTKTRPPVLKMTNRELGERLGCSDSMASRIRSGSRAPGARSLPAVLKTLDVDAETGLAAYAKGPEAFGALLRKQMRVLWNAR